MKATQWIILVLLVLLGYTGYATFMVTKNLKVENPVIKLQANNGQGTLAPQNSVKCATGAKKGCVQFDEATLGPITFTILGGGNKNETCAKPETKWVITKVELTALELQSTGKGDYAYTQPAADWLADAFPGLNALTGVVYDRPDSSATASAVIFDLNNHDKNEGVKELYYRVTAKDCVPPPNTTTIVTDPMVRNKGK